MAAYVTYGRAQRPVPQKRIPNGLIGLGCIALFGLAACGKLGLGGSSDDMSFARAALERNDKIEVVAADPATGTFTVRVKDTGELKMIKADQVVGAPPGMAAAPAGATATLAGGAAPDAASAPVQPVSNPVPAASGPSASPGNSAMTAQSGPGNDASAPTSSSQRMMRASPAADTADTSAPRTGFRPDPVPPSEVPNPNSDVASITPGGRVLESGPGYAIKTASNSKSVTARVERERSATTNSAIERRHDPIICQGDRLLQIDNRNLEFDGDAVSAQDGCEIHITNSHITAKGVGVSARHANVHIDNSQIEGDSASIEASDGAQVYATSSKFKGISRRVTNSSFHDLGGNVWN